MNDLKATVYVEEARKESVIDRLREKYDEIVFSLFYDRGFSEPDVRILIGAGRITRKDYGFCTTYYFDGTPLFVIEVDVSISDNIFKASIKYEDLTLKPCPFCGGTSLKTGSETECMGRGENVENYYVNCQNCGVKVFGEGFHGVSLVETVKSWNRRTDLAEH